MLHGGASTSSISRTRGWDPTPTISSSLLRDSYVDLTEREVDELIAYFLALTGDDPALRGGVPPPLRSDGAAAQPEGARHVRLSDDGTRRIPSTSSTSRARCATCGRTSRSTDASRGCATAGRAHRTSCANMKRFVRWLGQRAFGVSTHLYHDSRLSRGAPAGDRSHGFDTVELFATRTHFDYHNPAAVADLQQWLAEAGLSCTACTRRSARASRPAAGGRR